MRKSDQFSSHDDGTRLDRVSMFSKTIYTYVVEIDVSGDKLSQTQAPDAENNQNKPAERVY